MQDSAVNPSNGLSAPSALHIEREVNLRAYNSFGLPALARNLVRIRSEADVRRVVDHPDFGRAPKFVLGGGSNVVNVILVDFRGFDTFGEITVLGLAGLLLIKLLQQGSTSHAEIPTAPMLRLGVRLLLPFGLLVAVYLFLRGHQQPGGGFVAGLVTVVFLVLPVLAGMRGSRLAPPRWMAWGLAVALLTGCGAWWFDSEFLSSAHGHWQLPWLGELEWATAALFDLAVYLLVVGAGWALFTRLAQYQPEEKA